MPVVVPRWTPMCPIWKDFAIYCLPRTSLDPPRPARGWRQKCHHLSSVLDAPKGRSVMAGGSVGPVGRQRGRRLRPCRGTTALAKPRRCHAMLPIERLRRKFDTVPVNGAQLIKLSQKRSSTRSESTSGVYRLRRRLRPPQNPSLKQRPKSGVP